MSFLEKFFAFFTLKTSAELRGEAFEKKSTEPRWPRDRFDLDVGTNYIINSSNDVRDTLVRIKDVINNLLGDDLVCLLEAPIIQQTVAYVSDDKSECAIHLQWGTGNNSDEMAIMSVEFHKFRKKFRLTCATKCIGPESNIIRGSHVSEWGDVALPIWFKEVLELIKEVHADHIDWTVQTNLDDVINKKVMEVQPYVEAQKSCADIISYILHDEYQDMAYYPKISSSGASKYSFYYGRHLIWEMENNERLWLDVQYWYGMENINMFKVIFRLDARNKIETVFSNLTEDHAKSIIMPKWFVEKLEKVKNSTFGDNKD